MWRWVFVCALVGDARAERLGVRWQEAENPPAIDHVWGSGSIFYGAGTRGAFRSFDGGATWSTLSNDPAKAVFVSTADDVWIVEARSLRHGIGKQWTTQPLHALSFGAQMEGMWGTGVDLYVYGVDRSDGAPAGAILRSRNGGATWQREQLPAIARIAGVWGSGPDDVYAVGAGGAILHSTGDGNWQIVRPATTGSLEAIWGSSPTAIYAVGTNGAIVSYDGKAWTARTSGVRYTLSSIVSVNGTILVGSHDGAPLRSPDGKTWSKLTAMVSRGEVSAAGHGLVVVASTAGVHYLGDMPMPDARYVKPLAITPMRHPDTIEILRQQQRVYARFPAVSKLLDYATAVIGKSAKPLIDPGAAEIKLGAISKCSAAIDRPGVVAGPNEIVVDVTCGVPCGPSSKSGPVTNWLARTPAGPLSGSFGEPKWCTAPDLAAATDEIERRYQALLWHRSLIERDPAARADVVARYLLDGGRESEMYFELATLLARPVGWRGFFWSQPAGNHSCNAATVTKYEEAGDRQATTGTPQGAYDSYIRVAHCTPRALLKTAHVACLAKRFDRTRSFYQHLPDAMADQLAVTCTAQGFDPRK